MRKQAFATIIGVLLVLSVFSVLQFGQIKPVEATTFLTSGWENSGGTDVNDTAAWDGNVSCSVSSTTKYEGSYSFFATESSYVYYNATPTDGPLYARGMVYVVSLPTDTSFEPLAVGIFDSSAVYGLRVIADHNGTTWIWSLVDTGYSDHYNSTTQISIGVWYSLKIVYYKNGVGQSKLYINGALAATNTGMQNPNQAVLVTFGTFGLSAGLSEYIDSCVITDTDIAEPTGISISSTSASSNLAGQSCTFTGTALASNGNVSGYVFGTNNTGAFTNETWVTSYSNSTSATGSVSKTLNATVGNVVTYEWWFNDTDGNWVNSGLLTLTTTTVTNYSVNAVWIADQGPSWPVMQPNILTNNLSKVVTDCHNNNITMVFVCVGYWNAASNNIDFLHVSSFYTTVINAFHAQSINVSAWAEDGGGGTMDITPSNRQNLYNSITTLMSWGFDGYHDDIENWIGTTQQYIDYLNNATSVLHSLGKQMTAAVMVYFDGYNSGINMYLHMDYIVPMFYSSLPIFEGSQAAAFWQETFGLFGGDYGAPASPILMGLMNYYACAYPLPWQLAQTNYMMQTYTHRQLAGFCIWIYEYMGTRSDDWQQWNYWINSLATTPATLYSISLGSTPISGVNIAYQGQTQYTNTSEYTFNISQSLTAASSFSVETISSLFGTVNHAGSAGGYNGYGYTSGPYTLSSPTPVNSMYFYSAVAGNVKLAVYNSTSYHITGWVGTDEHPDKLQTYSSATACAANAWTLVSVSSVTLAAGVYFVEHKIDTTGMLVHPNNETSSEFYGHGQYIVESYATAFSSTFPTPSGALGNHAVFVPTAPISYTPYSFQKWEDDSTNVVRTVSTVTSNVTLTVYYTSGTVPAINLMYPINSTYSFVDTASAIPVNFTASGGTIDQKWYNVLNGTSGSTWVYVSNQTFTVYTTMTGFVNGTYTFYGFANNTVPTTGYSTVVFTVEIITSEGRITELIVNTWWSGYW